jgi:dihydrofolate reductase
MASQVIAYVAVSIDGYIAGVDGSVDFLEQFGTDEYDFHGFFDSIDAVVMGSTTYEQILDFGWPYGETPGLVLTSRDLETPAEAHISFSSEPTGPALKAYASQFDRRVWVVGGGKVITDSLVSGAVDVLETYVMPIALGTGVPLFAAPYSGRLDLNATHAYSNGVVKLVYSTAS